jgi:hypothetical protein
MNEDLEDVLRRVAAGELTPEAALHALGGTPTAPPEPPKPRVGEPGEPGEPPDEPVTSVRLKTSYRSVQISTDPTVAQIHISGDHALRRSGSVLEVTTSGPLDDDERAAADERSGTPSGGRFSFSDLPRTIAWARSWRDHQLTVRINPALALDLDLTGADVKLSGLQAGLHAHLVASSLKADRMRCEFDVEAVSSSVKLTAIPTGNSRIYCESSSVRLSLPAGADLTITGHNRMSRLSLPDQQGPISPFDGETGELTIGDGRDRLRLEAVMSSVTVQAQAWGWVPS